MFGYVTIYHKGLEKPELDRYQAYYCGLCRTLGQKYGLPGQLTLSYDLAFIAILHSALYEPETQFSAGRCAPHPIKARPRAANEFLDYAADMTIALAYYNFLDNWQDDHSRASLHQAQKLEPYLAAIRARWPRQTAAITAQLEALNALEKAGSHDLDALCRAFGDLLGAVFAFIAGIVYKKHKNRGGALWGSVAGAAAMAVISIPINYFIVYPAYVVLYQMPLEAIVGMYQAILPAADSLWKCLLIFNVPFTFCKGLLDVGLCFLIYKPLSPLLHK